MRSRGALSLTVLLVAAGCLGSAAKSAEPTTFYVQVRNNLPRAVYVLKCIDTRCLGFEMTMRLRSKAKAPVFATTGATNIYVVEINDNRRLGCLFLTYDVPPPASTVRRLSPLARCPR